jgi:ribosomal protein S26
VAKMNRSEAGKLGSLKARETHNRQKQERINTYNLNPTRCKFCNTAFEYSKRTNKFCGHSCAAAYNNKGVRRHGKSQKSECVNCGKEITNEKYCNINCQKHHQMMEKIEGNTASSRTVKKYLIFKYGDKCQRCGWCEIHPITGNVPIELEHIDGNHRNNNLNNVILLCPNCHSLTPTYKALNKGNGRHSRRQRYKEGKSF